MKTCTHCRETRGLDCFYADRRTKDGYHAWCKECVREGERRRYAANPEANVAKVAKWRRTHPERSRSHNTTRRARVRNQLCTVHPECRDIDLRPLFGATKCCGCGKGLSAKTMQVDHILPIARGGIHCRFNLRPTCRKCNSIKHAKVPDQVPLFMLSEHPQLVARIYGWEVTA